MANLKGWLNTGWEKISCTIIGNKVAVDVVSRDGDGGVLGSSDAPASVEVKNTTPIDMSLVDENGPVDLSNIELILPTPLKADRVTAISTEGGTVAQTGILKANLFNSGNTTLTVWFGEAIGAGKAIYLSPGQSWNESVDNKSGLYYDSDAAGGQLDYVLLG